MFTTIKRLCFLAGFIFAIIFALDYCKDLSVLYLGALCLVGLVFMRPISQLIKLFL